MREFEKLIDLHTHTIYSDGDLTPGELIDLAKKKNVRTISITDHDTISGNKEIFSQDIKDIKIIPGIELTARTTVGKMHILGYNIDIDNKNLNSKLDELHNSNLEYISAIFYHLKKNIELVLVQVKFLIF